MRFSLSLGFHLIIHLSLLGMSFANCISLTFTNLKSTSRIRNYSEMLYNINLLIICQSSSHTLYLHVLSARDATYVFKICQKTVPFHCDWLGLTYKCIS